MPSQPCPLRGWHGQGSLRCLLGRTGSSCASSNAPLGLSDGLNPVFGGPCKETKQKPSALHVLKRIHCRTHPRNVDSFWLWLATASKSRFRAKNSTSVPTWQTNTLELKAVLASRHLKITQTQAKPWLRSPNTLASLMPNKLIEGGASLHFREFAWRAQCLDTNSDPLTASERRQCRLSSCAGQELP